jgi:SpoVK/Ycf46/Vps4 family AAA+-type ATPase
MHDMETITELERQLLAAPFDDDIRLRYAELLLAKELHNEALQQFRLVLMRPAATARAHVGAAQCLLALGHKDDAVAEYSAARGKDGFAPIQALEELCASARRSAPAKLSLLRTGPEAEANSSSNVVPIARAQRDRIKFDDVAGMEDLKRTVRLQIVEPFLRPGLFAKFRKRAGGGVLLYGPPGCGKTMMARAIAGECRAQFVSVGISDVLSMWYGQSEQNLAAMFDKARQSAPSVLFFDELDALAYARSKASSEHTRHVVNEFLSQLDGFAADNEGVLVLAATNMPWDVDPAMKRPGRFARQIFVAPPDEDARAAIIEIHLRDIPLEAVDTAALARATVHYSGADVEGFVELAKEFVLEDHIARGVERSLSQADLLRAIRQSKPSTLDWLRTARNLVKYAGSDDSYGDVEDYLRKYKLI